MHKMLHLTLYSFLILTLAACSDPYRTERFYSMGTFVSVTLTEKNFDKTQDIRAKMQELENTIKSATETANKTQNFNFSGVMQELNIRGSEFSDITDGRFNIFAHTISILYGFPEGPFRVPDDNELDQALDNIDKKQNVMVDMGAYAKGYIVDKAVSRLKAENINSALINAGGDLYAMGSKGARKWRVAIKHPETSEEMLSIVNLRNKALATSGDYERFFQADDGTMIFHIFDATTGKNPLFYSSVSVIADDTVTADGLATVFFLLPPEDIKIQCSRLKTPVLLFTKDKEKIKLCGWEKFENN
ncbi:ApbE family lipoprotein [Denitrovibrio acetiphilus DSM 12809]|uniref:FAD:protein FMN transferase n=1 Tax=Denitrovibrio acetiphilus (strain DSM 12809 / NBRC 114555 / N2460) TaxID=522772 RepID=D4H7G8_DENA2|nr:FAD:protein FMN transferase [Denitrovibrio acetiphilus]ADD67967.1 ApbE family lipoprotein [Denitrovibrio acetiphilus DSM 12809]